MWSSSLSTVAVDESEQHGDRKAPDGRPAKCRVFTPHPEREQYGGGDCECDLQRGQWSHALDSSSMPSERASPSGTSRVIRRRAVENTLPCASVFSESVPPPSSAPWRRKFSAFRLGSSKRTTGPSISPSKWRATASRVTCFSISGYHSGRSAINPTLAVSPLSPDLACAIRRS